MLSITNLQSGYGKKHVLYGVTLHVGTGEVVSLLGRNGMGKTTSLRTIMGLNPAWQGRIEFLGRDITHASPNVISRLGLGYVPEGRGIFPNLTVYENLAMSARPGRWTLERVYELFPRLQERLSHWGNQLSGGEQQMLAIGRALLLNPHLMMLDEVMEGLAPLDPAGNLAVPSTHPGRWYRHPGDRQEHPGTTAAGAAALRHPER